ncbi:hypothetical protein FQN50_001554 [Emmonsiellopsis sp. PD_5]|nr:hypothetical protein FQN50_001554 [Emmonsiellopsis sp. PD_5]
MNGQNEEIYGYIIASDFTAPGTINAHPAELELFSKSCILCAALSPGPLALASPYADFAVSSFASPDTGDFDDVLMDGDYGWTKEWLETQFGFEEQALLKGTRFKDGKWQNGTEVSSYIKSAIRSPEYEAALIEKGVEFAPPESVAMCMMKIASDRTINGHSFMICPSSYRKEGYKDMDMDDFKEDGYLVNNEARQLWIIEDRWVEGWSKNTSNEGLVRK